MAEFSVLDVEVLREIVDGSLQTTVRQIAKQLEKKESVIRDSLQTIGKTKLVEVNGDNISVDKEMRRYYEFQLQRFQENFKPDIEFLQGVLSKVPIHTLPEWYALPRMTENIFTEIVQRYLCTPRIYERYLEALDFDIPLLHALKQEVFAAKNFQIPVKSLMEKYKIEREQFEELILYLEYHLVCYVGYRQVGESWEEVVSPSWEWCNYLSWRADNTPKAIENIQEVEPISLEKPEPILGQYETHVKEFLEKLGSVPYKIKDVYDLERGLADIVGKGWVYLEDFIESSAIPLGLHAPVSLQNKGRSWRYEIPTYGEMDKEFIRTVLLELFFKAGILLKAKHGEKWCIQISPLGKARFS
jgi:predicted transcriptional regulator